MHDEDESDGRDGPAAGPVPLSTLADLQAGLLDDATAATLRRRIRDDPVLARRFATLEQVRHSVADLSTDPAPPIPAEVAATIGAALRAADGPEHRVVAMRDDAPHHRSQRPLRRPGVVIGAAAALVALGVGGAELVTSVDRPLAPAPAAALVTVPRQSGMPWSDQQILGLLTQPAALGPLADAGRLASCMHALGYSDTGVLGAATLTTLGHPAVLLVLPRPDTTSVMALLISDTCNARDAGLLADAVIERPAKPAGAR